MPHPFHCICVSFFRLRVHSQFQRDGRGLYMKRKADVKKKKKKVRKSSQQEKEKKNAPKVKENKRGEKKERFVLPLIYWTDPIRRLSKKKNKLHAFHSEMEY